MPLDQGVVVKLDRVGAPITDGEQIIPSGDLGERCGHGLPSPIRAKEIPTLGLDVGCRLPFKVL